MTRMNRNFPKDQATFNAGPGNSLSRALCLESSLGHPDPLGFGA